MAVDLVDREDSFLEKKMKMEIYSFDEADEAQAAVKTAMAEAGCYGPELEKQCAGQSPVKNLISSFIRWRERVATMRMTITVTQGLGKHLATLLSHGDTGIPPMVKPDVQKVEKPANWLEDSGVEGLYKRFGADDLEAVMERVFVACEGGKVVDISDDGENIVEADVEDLDVDLDVLARCEQIQAFNIHFQPKKKD